MMLRKLCVTLAMGSLLLAGVYGCSDEKKVDVKPEDVLIIQEIKTSVTGDPSLETAIVEFSSNEGVVLITGTVESANQEEYLKNKINTIKGVKRVESRVKYPSSTTPSTNATTSPMSPTPVPNNTQITVPPSTPVMTPPASTTTPTPSSPGTPMNGTMGAPNDTNQGTPSTGTTNGNTGSGTTTPGNPYTSQ